MTLDWHTLDRWMMGEAWTGSSIEAHLNKLCRDIGPRWSSSEAEWQEFVGLVDYYHRRRGGQRQEERRARPDDARYGPAAAAPEYLPPRGRRHLRVVGLERLAPYRLGPPPGRRYAV